MGLGNQVYTLITTREQRPRPETSIAEVLRLSPELCLSTSYPTISEQKAQIIISVSRIYIIRKAVVLHLPFKKGGLDQESFKLCMRVITEAALPHCCFYVIQHPER